MVAIMYGADDRAFALVPTGVQTSNYTAAANQLVVCDSSSGALSVTLPTAPADRTLIGIKLINSAADPNPVTVHTGAGDVFNKTGGSTTATLDVPYQGLIAQYEASTGVWFPVSDDLPLAQLDVRYGFVTSVKTFGATGNGTTDDTAAINAALVAANAAGGGIVVMPWGTYLVSGTISIPPYVQLVGQVAVSLNLNTPPATTSRIVAAAGWAPSSSTGIVSIMSKTPGGWAVNSAAAGLKQIYIDGSLNSNTNLQGINLVGPVYDVHLEDVFVFTAPHNGITASGQTESGITPTYPYHARFDRVNVVSAGNYGFNITNFTDSTFNNCLAFGNTSNGWTINNCSNTELNCCRAEWNKTGFSASGSAGTTTFTGCTTDQNSQEGLLVSAATGQAVQGGGIVWTGGKLHADGNSGTSGHTYGIQITGSTVPIAITGVNVESGENINNSTFYPASAIGIGTSSNVAVTGSILQGITAAWTDNGGNTIVSREGCLGATGNPNTQVFTQLPDLSPTVQPDYLPSDLPTPLLAWNFDPAYCASGSAITLTDITLIRVNIRYPMKVTNVVAYITALGATLTSSENYAGIYNSAGTRIAVTADQTTNWETGGTVGENVMPLVGGPYDLAPGFYWVALLANGTTAPTFLRMPTPFSSSSADLGQSVTASRCATNGTGTTLPSSVTPSSNTNAGQLWWAGVS